MDDANGRGPLGTPEPTTAAHGRVDDGGTGAGHRHGRARIASLADAVLPSLLARLESSTLGELEVREDGWRVRLRRPLEPARRADGNGATRAPGVGDHGRRRGGRDRGGEPVAPGAAVVGVGPGRTGSDRSNADGRRGGRHSVVSPAVGYYTPRDGIGAGHSVRAGDVLGHVDVLGVRQEVVAGADVIVARLLVEPGEAVEYGQELVRLDLRGGDA